MGRYNEYDLRPRVQGEDPPQKSVRTDDTALLEACREALFWQGLCRICMGTPGEHHYECVGRRLDERLKVKP